MSEELIKSVQEMLNEEKWTRTTIPDYSTRNFEELDKIIDKIEANGCINEVKELCDEHLSVTKDSIIALFLSGVLSLKKHSIDDSAMLKLVNIFVDKPNKGDIVVYLCNRILQETKDSKFALKTLTNYYASIKDKDEAVVLQIWKDLVQADSEEAEIAKHIAEKYEQDFLSEHKDSDKQLAIEYYTKALNRYINQHMEDNVDLIWGKLIELRLNDIEFFYHMEKKISKKISHEKAAKLLSRLYDNYKKIIDSNEIEDQKEESKYWDWCIEILKKILSYNENDSVARNNITDCYKGKYKDHSQLLKCINSSDLTRGYRNVFEAISDFEKRIAFDKGNFVYHRTLKVGKIESVENNTVVIQFLPKQGTNTPAKKQTMTLDMAVNSLQVLGKKHIWVIKTCCSASSVSDKIKDIVKDSTGKKISKSKTKDSLGTKWILKTIIQSFNNNCDMKRIKDELVPDILKPTEWTTWSVKARKMLNTDSTFAVNPNDMDSYQVRVNLSSEEKLYNEFKAQKDFFARLKILDTYVFPGDSIPESQKPDLDSDFFKEMFEYFNGYLNTTNTVNEQTIASYLEIEKINQDSEAKTVDCVKKNDFKCQFSELFDNISDISELYTNLKNTELRKLFLNKIYSLIPNWEEVYANLFHVVLSEDIITPLVNEGHIETVQKLLNECIRDFRKYRESFIWFFKNSRNEPWYKSMDISLEKMLITLIKILYITYREIENHFNTVENRKINKQIQNLLFENGKGAGILENYMLENGKETALRLYTLIDDIRDLEPSIRLGLKSKIAEKFKDIKFRETEDKAITSEPKGLIVTSKMYTEKQKELEHIMAEIIANTKDISDAREQGDLKENAEYKAAKEKEGHLNTSATKLKDEIDRAIMFDPATVNTNIISFGTTAVLFNENTKKEEKITILGPWESNPEQGVISYLAPFGKKILNHKVGEKLNFEINENKSSYTVKEILPVKF